MQTIEKYNMLQNMMLETYRNKCNLKCTRLRTIEKHMVSQYDLLKQQLRRIDSMCGVHNLRAHAIYL